MSTSIDFDQDRYKGMHIIAVLQAEGASVGQAQELGGHMQAISALSVAQWGMPLDWEVSKEREGQTQYFKFHAYTRNNLTEVNLSV